MGISILGMVGGIEVCDILEKAVVAGDLSELWLDIDWDSAREELLRDPEVLEADLSLRENMPIITEMLVYWCGLVLCIDSIRFTLGLCRRWIPVISVVRIDKAISEARR